MNSEHPLAKAIVEYAKKLREGQEKPVWPEVQDFVSLTGQGVKAIVRNKEIILGNKSLMLESNISIPKDAEEALAEAEGMAQTGIIVSIDREVAGVMAISDPLKPGAREVISILKFMKVKSIMVTGDNWGTANSIAKEVGIETVIAEAKPEQKAEEVKDLQVCISKHSMMFDEQPTKCFSKLFYLFFLSFSSILISFALLISSTSTNHRPRQSPSQVLCSKALLTSTSTSHCFSSPGFRLYCGSGG